ncbi:DUF2269 domain-containing protein [Corynebacterium yudongzhengii]|uniref:DUF2269 domain-containing protein n=1 Tax=Corynebacterium yudongzhengii TaxID=2080740 RepID=A0A2U1T9G0_9CORY|nr:DUF2269 domain-containing protein [Corynebacterium yudongzhengii]AWB82142.1 DUF2269 domain-containing protein [Corynebacterium yudongzhengii]PWC02646.1 DUF2269 domain-containing protein [Corynebacterium yudongzhengii]
MSTIFVFLHVAAAILFLGAVTYGTSVFPKAALAASNGDTANEGIARSTHRMSTLYGYLSALVPLFGITLLFTDWDTYASQPQYHTALLLGVIAWALLLFFVIPKQKKMAAAAGLLAPGEATVSEEKASPVKLKKQLTISSGIFNLLWIIMLVLMYI